jgi:hypothetical protein
MKIYFDENFSLRLVEGLRAFQAGVPHEGIEVLSIAETFGKGTPDEEWIPKVAQQHGVAITQDWNIHRKRHQWELCQKYKIVIIFVQPPKKGWSYWFIIQLIVKLWKEITEQALRLERPYAAEIKATTGRLRLLS